MKKMFVISLVLAAAFAIGCSKKQAATTPSNKTDTKTEMKQGSGSMGGATYGGAKAGGGEDPCGGK
jgi:hypothetical protein